MEYIQLFINETGYFYYEMAIYLVFGFLVAGILHVFFPDSIVRKHLGKPGMLSMIKSTLFGIPLPLCSCGVVPVATSLRRSGASKGATVSFLISTPQIGADSFLLTYSLLGWVFAVFRIITSLLTAILAGIALLLFDKEKPAQENSDINQTTDSTPAQRLKDLPAYIEYELFGSIAGTLLVGILVAGLIGVLLPNGFFEQYFNYPFLSMLIMLVVGIPMYVCASASTPIAASLVLKGLNPGAALVFLLTGPATNAVNLSTVSSIIGKKSTLLYLTSISAVAMLMGYVFNLMAGSIGIDKIVHQHNHEILPLWLKWSGVVLLTAMFIYYYWNIKIKKLFGKKTRDTKVSHLILDVQGMNCMHCAGSVKSAVESIEGTSEVHVDLDSGIVDFELENEQQLEQVKQKIKGAGFEV